MTDGASRLGLSGGLLVSIIHPTGTGIPMPPFLSRSRTLPIAALLLSLASPALAAEEADAPKGAAVTVLTAAKSCFGDIVEVSGLIIAREETMVRPERMGL